MKKLFFLLCVILINSFPLFSQPKVSSIRIINSKYFSEKELQEKIPLKKNTLYSSSLLEQSLQTILTNYQQHGFFLPI